MPPTEPLSPETLASVLLRSERALASGKTIGISTKGGIAINESVDIEPMHPAANSNEDTGSAANQYNVSAVNTKKRLKVPGPATCNQPLIIAAVNPAGTGYSCLLGEIGMFASSESILTNSQRLNHRFLRMCNGAGDWCVHPSAVWYFHRYCQPLTSVAPSVVCKNA
jgi:hypothetical protein